MLKNLIKQPWRYKDSFLVLTLVAGVALLAWHFGWLNDDALNYLALGEHIRLWQGVALRPSWGDTYWAVFPAGYPSVIALLSLLTGDVFSASKLANGLLLAGSIFLASLWLRIPLLFVAALFSTVWMLEIVSYSWSENSFIFAYVLALASMAIFLDTGHKKWLLAYVAGLILAISSRYIGGFMLGGFLLLLGLASFRYTRPRVWPLLASTLVCTALFALYLVINQELTGYQTGMQRQPAREGFGLLVVQFLEQLLYSLWMFVPPLLMLLVGMPRFTRPRIAAYPLAWPPIILGVCHLTILFVLRSLSHFEQFSGRLLAPGTLLIGLGVLHIACRAWMVRVKPGGLARLVFVAAFLLNLAVVYRDIGKWPNIITDESSARAFAKYHEKYDPLADGTVIITTGLPDPSVGWRFVSPVYSADRVFYLLLDNPETTLPQLRAYLARLRYKNQPPAKFVFDFSGFANIETLEMALKARNLSPEVSGWIKSYFSAGAWVECRECNK